MELGLIILLLAIAVLFFAVCWWIFLFLVGTFVSVVRMAWKDDFNEPKGLKVVRLQE